MESNCAEITLLLITVNNKKKYSLGFENYTGEFQQVLSRFSMVVWLFLCSNIFLKISYKIVLMRLTFSFFIHLFFFILNY